MDDFKEELDAVNDELQCVEVELRDLLERQTGLLERKAELKAIITQHEDLLKQKKNQSWERADFPWIKNIEDQLESVFGLKQLRSMQQQTMNVTLSGEDCLLVMPTGGGKSLCFQLPAVIGTGLTLVVSPLVSLMEDQLMALEELGVRSAMLNASTNKEDLKDVQDDMVQANGKLRLLYVTPEKLAKSKRFMNRLEKCYATGHLDRLVIDEVHCCSQWGHDFRPDYKFLGIMKRQFPKTPILGLTATATTKVLEDVKKILNIPNAILLKAPFNRPNLFYEIQAKPSSQKETMNLLHHLIDSRFRGKSGIVYCFSRKDSEEVTSELMSRGIQAGCYHSDIDAMSRSRVHRSWLSGSIQVVVATVAFGMGIDKPNVRFVIHHSISKSMENLYQESGRAGRDGQRSDCIILYRLADAVKQSTMVFTEQTGLDNLHGIIKYCTDVGTCRRSLIARHFGEVWDSSQCNQMCDNCFRAKHGGTVEKRDVTRFCNNVLVVLDAAVSINTRVTVAKLLDAWFGKGAANLKVKSVPVPCIGQDMAERLVAHMLTAGFLQEDFHFTAYSTICYLLPGPRAKMLRSKTSKVLLDLPSKSSTKPAISPTSFPPNKAKTDSTDPKLVIKVANKEKSHSTTLLSSPVSTNKSVSISSGSRAFKSSTNLASLGRMKMLSSGLGAKQVNKTTAKQYKTEHNEELNSLNFDDSDSEERKTTPIKPRKTQSSGGHCDEGQNGECAVNLDTVSKRESKVTLALIGHDDDIQPMKKIKMSSEGKDPSAPFKKTKKRKSVVISDDDDED